MVNFQKDLGFTTVLATSLNYVDYYSNSGKIKYQCFKRAFKLSQSETSEQSITLPRVDSGI